MSNWWEKADWPVNVQDELSSDHLEDVRKRIFLLKCPDTGNIDLYKYFGKGDNIPYNSVNWESGPWDAYEPPNFADPGDIIVLYEDYFGVVDIYVNYIEMSEMIIKENPPVDSEGMLNPMWRLYPNPNLYHHSDFNAGKPSIRATGRWKIFYHGEKNDDCQLKAYTCRAEAFRFLPQQTTPYYQIAPIKSNSNIEKRHSSYEISKEDITQNISTRWGRSLNESDYEECKWPRRLTEYVLEYGEPEKCNTSECEASGQCAWDPIVNSGYQDSVIETVERVGSIYLKKVDEQWIENFIWAQTKTLWTDSGPPTYNVGNIVYTDADLDVYYVCYNQHSASSSNKPGVGADWEDYWLTPAYQPEYIRTQPVYVQLNLDSYGESDGYSWHWGCNDSAFELLLKKLGGEDCNEYPEEDISTQFDWWWDVGHPAVPIWLYKYQHIGDPDPFTNWPLPRGCWRRTWKHSMGRVGSLMWPGEKGDPPGYEQIKFIVTQAVYNNIPTANQKYYAVQDVEELHRLAYIEEHEALIAKRHDPIHTRHHEYYDKKAGQHEWAHTPMHELHHNLVNDLRNVLLQLYLVDDAGLDIWLYQRIWMLNYVESEECCKDTSVECYDVSRAKTAVITPTDYYLPDPHAKLPVASFYKPVGYQVGIDYSYIWDLYCPHWVFPAAVEAYLWNPETTYDTINVVWTEALGKGTWFQGLDRHSGSEPPSEHWELWTPPEPPGSGCGGVLPWMKMKHAMVVEIGKDLGFGRPLGISNVLFRVGYKGMLTGDDLQAACYRADACAVGFADLTVAGEPSEDEDEIVEKVGYARLPLSSSEGFWEWDGPGYPDKWMYWCRYETQIVSPWPGVGGGWFDFDKSTRCGKKWQRQTDMDFSGGDGMNKYCVLEIDWDKVPESVFEDDLTNFVEGV